MDGSTPPQPAAPAEPATKRKRRKQSGGVKETIESILIAFILAFIFRAFVVEAFVIPTGSMATTLMGAHMNFTCTECGYKWRVNYNAQPTPNGDDLIIPSRAGKTYYLICPNCGFRMPRKNPADPDNQAEFPPIDFGDRILVLKYLYQFTDAQRWDVVVFKSPYDPKYQTNYIKRLVGKPGERIMVLDGDVYLGQKDDKLEDFKVQTKPHHAQEALWRIVYDNDFQPTDAGQQRLVPLLSGSVGEDPMWRQPWQEAPGGAGWKTGSAAIGDHAMHFDNLNGASKLVFEPVSGSLNFPLTNWLGYNITFLQDAVDSFERPPPMDPLPPHVSDLKLKAFYQRHSGDGAMRMEMTKDDDAFVAEFTPGKVRLLKYSVNKETVVGEKDWNAPSRAAEVEFSNVDYRVAIRIDGQDVIATTPEQYHPDVAELLADYRSGKPHQRPRVTISADKQQATLSHVSLWRDVYYTNSPAGPGRILWGTPDRPMQLGPDEFFVLGDNSSNSQDARYWPDPIKLDAEELDVAAGRVPARFMLGKAFFVYWPAGLKLFGHWGLVPNVGEMRFIH
jgi:signal peptidase I